MDWCRRLLPLGVVIPMIAVSSALRLPEIIFPEGAALAAGLWVLDYSAWSCSLIRVAVLPPICATLGVVLNDTLPLSAGLTQVAALVLALAVLLSARSRLAPGLSAAMFPTVFPVRGWYFPVSVAVICAVIAVVPAVRRRSAGAVGAAVPELPPRWPPLLLGGYLILSGAWIMAGHLIPGAPLTLLAPPLFVSGLESAVDPSPVRGKGPRRWALLTLAALAGSGAALLPPRLPAPLAAAVAVAIVVLLGDQHPPALAVCLIPFILGRPACLSFGAAVAVTAAVLLIAGFVLRRGVESGTSLRKARLNRRGSGSSGP